MNTRATLGLTAAAVVVGLVAGLGLGSGDDREVKAGGAGPSRTAAGVPVGYAQSKAGAVAAAIAYTRALNEAASLSVDDRRAVVAQISSPASRQEIQAKADEAYAVVDKAAPEGVSLFLRSGALAFKIDSYDDSQANVALWTVDVVGAATTGAQSGWGTKTVTLTWEGSDWKLAGFPRAQEGPTPTPQGQPTPVASFFPLIEGLEPLSHATTD